MLMFSEGLNLVRDFEEPPLEDASSFAGRPVEDGRISLSFSPLARYAQT
jgi:hypothetical protein